jgi:hypothetical protein
MGPSVSSSHGSMQRRAKLFMGILSDMGGRFLQRTTITGTAA